VSDTAFERPFTEARLRRLMDAARRLAAGNADVKPLNPEWDRRFLERVSGQHWAELEQSDDDYISQVAGNSAHEVRAWVAAISAVEALNGLQVQVEYYRPVPEWIAGFGIALADSTDGVGL